jgi:membrane protein YdbS with pleckstrin-like domain
MTTMATPEKPAENVLEDGAAEEPRPPAAAPEPPPQETPPPAIADGFERRLDPRSIPVERIVGWIVTASISLGMFLGLVIVLLAVPLLWIKLLVALLCSAAALAMAWSSHYWPEIEHRHASYKVDALGIEIRRGVWWRKVINVPRSRVQHTDVSQGPLERRYGLGTLVIYTAGTDYARVDLKGLDHGTALRIRDHLLPREEDDAV